MGRQGGRDEAAVTFVFFLVIWIPLAGGVAAAGEARGRSGVGWFFAAFFFSPFIAILLLLAFPNLKQEAMLKNIADGGRTRGRQPLPPPLPVPVFHPDGVYAGVPYRVADDGSIDAIMQGAPVRFRDFEKFTGAMGGNSN